MFLEIKYSPNNQYFAIGSSDGDVHFLETEGANGTYSSAGSCRGLEVAYPAVAVLWLCCDCAVTVL